MADHTVTDRPGAATTDRMPPPDPPHAAFRLVAWGVVASAVALVHNRLWGSPNLGAFATIAARWGSDPFGAASPSDYLLTNLSLPTIARALGMTEPHRYALLHLVVLLIGCAVCVGLAQRRFGYLAARSLAVVVAASPGVTVAMQWLGQPDALTLPLGMGMVLVRRRGAFVALAVLAGLTHPEQAVLVVACAAVVRRLVLPPEVPFDRLPVRHAGWRELGPKLGQELLVGLLGVGFGRVLVELYLRGFDVDLGRARSDYLRLGAELLVEHHLRAPAALVYLLWGPLWIVIAGVATMRVLARVRSGTDPFARSWLTLGALSLLALVPVAVTLDETRVYAMVTAPVLAGAVVLLTRELAGRWTRILTIGAVALLAVTTALPGGFTAGEDAWATQIPSSEFAEFLRTGDPPAPLFLWLLGPFDLVLPEDLTA